MFNGACDYESLSGQRLFLISHSFSKVRPQQMIQYLIVLIILKYFTHASASTPPIPSMEQSSSASAPAHGVQVKIEMAADHFRIRKTDPRDPESKDQPRQRRMGLQSSPPE